MSRCKRCNIEILDNTTVCPLCNHVLEANNEDNLVGVWDKVPNPYPDVAPAMKKVNFVVKCFFFLSLVVEALLVLINYLTFNGVYWSVICGGAFLYLCFTLRYAILHNSGRMNKITVLTIGAIVLTILIDYTLGYRGWSVNFAIPCGIMLIDLAILILMIVNSINWQSYLLFQVFMIFISFVAVLLTFFHVVTFALLTIIACVVTVLLFVGTLIFGDRRAITELNRRFRI